MDDLRESSEESCSDEEEADDSSNHGDHEIRMHQNAVALTTIEVLQVNESESFKIDLAKSFDSSQEKDVKNSEELETEVIESVAQDATTSEKLGNTESSSMLVQNASLPDMPVVTVTPPAKPALQRVPSTRSTSNYINTLKHRISNASLFKYREETRAARISALVIVMGLICWTPHVVVLILRNVSDERELTSHHFDILALSFLVLSTYVSPLLFGYRSRRVKRELRKFFCFRKELSYKNNRSLMAKKVLKRRCSGHGVGQLEMDHRYSIFNCVYGRNRWPKEKVQFVQVPDNALAVETCRSSFSSGASTQISTTSTDEC